MPPAAAALAPLAGAIAVGASGAGDDIIDAAGDMLGTNKEKSNVYQVNSGSYENPHSEESRAKLQAAQNNALGREAPQAQVAQRSQVATHGGTNVAGGTTINGVTFAPAAQATASTIDRSEDQQLRQQQLALAQRLDAQSQGQGPSLAASQMRNATDRNMALANALAASGGGNPALAMRQAQRGAAEANRDAARASAELRIAEQFEAQKQLAALATNTRQQDTEIAQRQADLRQRTEELNIDTLNRFEMLQKQTNFDAQKFNALQQQEMNKLQATLDQESGLFNAAAYNEMYGQNLSAETQTRLANLDAKMQQGQLNQQMYLDLVGKELALNEADRQANISMEQDKLKGSMGSNQLDMQAAEAANARASNITGGLLGAGGGAIAGAISDPAAKTQATDLTSRKPTSTWGTGKGATEAPKTTASMQSPQAPKDAVFDLQEKRFMSPDEAQEKASAAAKSEQLDKQDKQKAKNKELAKSISDKFASQMENNGAIHSMQVTDIGGGRSGKSFRDHEAMFTSDERAKQQVYQMGMQAGAQQNAVATGGKAPGTTGNKQLGLAQAIAGRPAQDAFAPPAPATPATPAFNENVRALNTQQTFLSDPRTKQEQEELTRKRTIELARLIANGYAPKGGR